MIHVPLRPAEALLAGASALCLALLTLDVGAGGLASQLDETIRDGIGRSGEPEGFLGRVDGVGNLGVSGGGLAVVTLVAVQVTWRLWPLLVAAGNAGAMGLVVLTLKYAVGRNGPVPVDTPPDYPGYFPSGHTASAAVCCGTAAFIVISIWLPRWRPQAAGLALVGGLLAGAVVGLFTIVGDHHWASDVVASLLLTCVVLPLGFAACRGMTSWPDDVPPHDRQQRPAS